MIADILYDAVDECEKYLNEFNSTYSDKCLGKEQRKLLMKCIETMCQTSMMLSSNRSEEEANGYGL